jgi:hypothetical protein
VNTISVDITGAAGGISGFGGCSAGYGARVQVTRIPVIPGSVLHVFVGGQGVNVLAGWNGGGMGAPSGCGGTYTSGGGGSSDIRAGGLLLSNRIIVAGGGGGYVGTASYGVQKGGDSGQVGLDGTGGLSGFTGGGGGSSSSGGSVTTQGPPATAGSLGFGGNGRDGCSSGGGGGYYGGKGRILFFFFEL